MKIVEVFVRITISDYISYVCEDVHWWRDVRYSQPLFKHLDTKNGSGINNEFEEVIKEIQKVNRDINRDNKKSEQWLKAISKTVGRIYASESCPKSQDFPSGVLFEHITMDCIITLLKLLPKKHQDIITKKLDIQLKSEDVPSVLYCFKSLRNIVAHYNPLLNATYTCTYKNLGGVKKIMKRAGYQFPPDDQNKEPLPPYAYFVVLHELCNCLPYYCNEEDTLKWEKKLSELLKNCHIDVCQHMHFPEKWEELAFWKKSISSSTCPNPNY